MMSDYCCWPGGDGKLTCFGEIDDHTRQCHATDGGVPIAPLPKALKSQSPEGQAVGPVTCRGILGEQHSADITQCSDCNDWGMKCCQNECNERLEGGCYMEMYDPQYPECRPLADRP